MISEKPDTQSIIDIAIKDFGLTTDEIQRSTDMKRVGLFRSVIAYILHDIVGMGYKDINETIPHFGGGTAHKSLARVHNGVYDETFHEYGLGATDVKSYAHSLLARFGDTITSGVVDHGGLIALALQDFGLTEDDLSLVRPQRLAIFRSVVTHILRTKFEMYYKDIAPLIGFNSPASVHTAHGRVLDGAYDRTIRTIAPDATSCVSYAQTVYIRAMNGGAA